MSKVQQDFQNRVDEIEAYLSFITRVDAEDTEDTQQTESRRIRMITADGDSPYSPSALNDLLRTFRASAILLLYNLMESTVTNAVEAIFDELTDQEVHFDDCRDEVRRVVLTNLKQHSPGDIMQELERLSTDIIGKTFKKNKIVSGNVDAKRIRALAKEYGINHPEADGSDLRTVKSRRNDLAHGINSFAEVGRDFSTADIIRIKTKVIAYLAAMLKNVADYIQQQHYRKSAVNP